MSSSGLFIVGVLVTLIVVAAVAPLVYAAVLDGRESASASAPRPPIRPATGTQLEPASE